MQYGRLGQQEYLEQANRDVFVMVQVETVELLAELDEVLRSRGSIRWYSGRRTSRARWAGSATRGTRT